MDLKLVIYIKNDSYKGIDLKKELPVKILKELSLEQKNEFVYNRQDMVDIHKKTILGQELMSAPGEVDSE